MAGLLGDVLPWIYSRGNVLQRQLNGLLSDPVGSVQQTAGLLSDYRTEDQRLNKLAFANPQAPFEVTNQNALAKLMERTMQGPMSFAPAGMTAWHGTPHVFEKFDSSKIGTGEGAQAYGHGLYLAESPATAEYYKGALTDRFPAKLDGKSTTELTSAQKSALGILNDYGGNIDGAISFAKRDMQRSGGAGADFHVERYNTLLDIKRGKAKADVASPSLYKVDLPDDVVAKMMDWDKPLSQQPEAVRVAAMDLGLPKTATGKDIYNALAQQARDMAITRGNNAATTLGASQAGASADLRGFGIPGIRYLDGGSRGAGQGSSNFVVFPGEESALKILERNGQPLK